MHLTILRAPSVFLKEDIPVRLRGVLTGNMSEIYYGLASKGGHALPLVVAVSRRGTPIDLLNNDCCDSLLWAACRLSRF